MKLDERMKQMNGQNRKHMSKTKTKSYSSFNRKFNNIETLKQNYEYELNNGIHNCNQNQQNQYNQSLKRYKQYQYQ